MRITEQHSRISITTYQTHFKDAQAHLKEPADGFMTQIMETHVHHSSFLLQFFPSQFYGVTYEDYHTCICLGSLFENSDSPGC